MGRIRPALAAIRSNQHACLNTGQHADTISVALTASMLLAEVNYEDRVMAGEHTY